MSPRIDISRLRARRAGVSLLAVGAAMAVALPACGGGGSSASQSDYTVRAIFDNAAFLIKDLDVKIAGVKVGSVLDVELTDENQAAVTFSITDPGFKDLREDATCGIRPAALIGERYVECELTAKRPEGASPPPPLATIKSGPYEGQRLLESENTSVPIDPDLLLNTSNESARTRFAIIIRELGVGLQGRGDKLETALDKGNDALVLTNKILKQLSEQTDLIKNLTTDSDRVLASLAAERSSITGAIENGATVSSTLAARKEELAATIVSLDKLFTEIEPSTNKALELTDELGPIADDLNASADDLAVILNGLPEFSSRGESAITALGPTVDKGREVLTSDETGALIDRFGRTAAVAKTTGSVLGLTLGDLRTTGGLDYFLDAIYGLAYATNGRDGNGAFLRGNVLGAGTCAILQNVRNNTACGNRLAAENVGRLSAADRKAGSKENAPGRAEGANSGTRSGASTDPASTNDTAARLLFGGSR